MWNNLNEVLERFFICFRHFEYLTQIDDFAKAVALA